MKNDSSLAKRDPENTLKTIDDILDNFDLEIADEDTLTVEERRCELEFMKARTAQILVETEAQKLEVEKLTIELKDTKAGPDEAQVYPLLGEIEPLTGARLIQTTALWSRRNPGSDMTILLSSGGGDVVSGLAIYDHIQGLKASGHRITIKVMSMAASMAAILLQSATERVMSPSAVMMLHEGQVGFIGTVAGLKDSQKMWDLMHKRCEDAVTSRSGLTSRKYKALINRKDSWLGADEALALGLVDKVEA